MLLDDALHDDDSPSSDNISLCDDNALQCLMHFGEYHFKTSVDKAAAIDDVRSSTNSMPGSDYILSGGQENDLISEGYCIIRISIRCSISDSAKIADTDK